MFTTEFRKLEFASSEVGSKKSHKREVERRGAKEGEHLEAERNGRNESAAKAAEFSAM